MGANFMDEIDCGSFFDQIDDIIDFPPDNECGSGLGSEDCKNFPSIWNDTLPENDSLFPSSDSHSGSDLSTDLAVPYEDIVQLEWLSTFVEDSFADCGLTIAKENISVKEPSRSIFSTSSPVSVLESSSSSSSSSSCPGGKIKPLGPGPQRARSKRPRPATFSPRPVIKLISPTSSFTEAPQPVPTLGAHFESENFAESQPMRKVKSAAAPEPKRKKKINFTCSSSSLAETDYSPPPAQAVRKCLHCEITKTPQWRAGPMGPKTLCNACGVRYKSGRLFPEYRPAASPTFVPSLHSNSHKKVIEMRSKGCPQDNANTIPATASTITKQEITPDSNSSFE